MTTNFRQVKFAASLSILLCLVGCGGGGGGAASAASSSTSTNQSSGQTGSSIVPANLQSSTSANYPAGSDSLEVYQGLAAFRAAQGLGPLNENTALDVAANNHLLYQVENGTYGHSETTDFPGYTGVDPLTRAQYAGYGGTTVAEDISEPAPSSFGQPGAGQSSINNLIDSVYHRATLMYQGLTDVGIAAGTAAQGDIVVIDMGYATQQTNASNYFGMYPTDGQTGVALHAIQEIPTPYPDLQDSQIASLTGFPISVASVEGSTLTIASFTVTQHGQASPLGVRLFTQSDPNLAGSTNLAFIVSNSAFLPNTQYDVSFSGAVNGSPISRNWSFTTGGG